MTRLRSTPHRRLSRSQRRAQRAADQPDNGEDTQQRNDDIAALLLHHCPPEARAAAEVILHDGTPSDVELAAAVDVLGDMAARRAGGTVAAEAILALHAAACHEHWRRQSYAMRDPEAAQEADRHLRLLGTHIARLLAATPRTGSPSGTAWRSW